jgi:hypothetical protein
MNRPVFTTKFSYRLIKEGSCEADKPSNAKVVLELSTEVTVTAFHRTRDEYCNPTAGLDLSEPLRVFLTSCQVDGSPVPCDQMTIRLHSGASTAIPRQFKESDAKQGFVVPKEFRSLKNFDINVDTHGEEFVLPDVDAHFLKGN